MCSSLDASIYLEKLSRGKKLNQGRISALTRHSIYSGLVPSICPICKDNLYSPFPWGGYGRFSSPDHHVRLLTHHWEWTLIEAVRWGTYRRVCESCNVNLGVLFRGDYPEWTIQYRALTSLVPGWGAFHPNFDSSEGWWSMIDWSVELDSFLKSEGDS